jgi:hypothetical protein
VVTCTCTAHVLCAIEKTLLFQCVGDRAAREATNPNKPRTLDVACYSLITKQ